MTGAEYVRLTRGEAAFGTGGAFRFDLAERADGQDDRRELHNPRNRSER